MMWRVAVSSKTSSFASGGSPIHSTECVNHGFGGFSTYCIKLICVSSALSRGSNCHRFDRAKRNEDLLPGRARSLSQTHIIIRDLDDASGINPARHSLHVHHFSLEAAKEILNVLACHSSPRFFPRHKEVAILVRILKRHKASAPAFVHRRQNVRAARDQIIVKLIDIRNPDEEVYSTPTP